MIPLKQTIEELMDKKDINSVAEMATASSEYWDAAIDFASKNKEIAQSLLSTMIDQYIREQCDISEAQLKQCKSAGWNINKPGHYSTDVVGQVLLISSLTEYQWGELITKIHNIVPFDVSIEPEDYTHVETTIIGHGYDWPTNKTSIKETLKSLHECGFKLHYNREKLMGSFGHEAAGALTDKLMDEYADYISYLTSGGCITHN